MTATNPKIKNNATNDRLIPLLQSYHQSHEAERRELLHLPEIRKEVQHHVKYYEQKGHSKRLSRQKLNHLLLLIEDPSMKPETYLPFIDELRFPMEFWNQLRATAEELPGELTLSWKEHRDRTSNYRNEILEETAYLVPKIRRIHFTIDPQRIDDADGNGFLGLLKAIDNFSQEESRSFEAYAKIYILNQIVCYLRNDKLVKPSDTLRRFYSRHDSTVAELRQSLKREPTSQEVAEALEIDQEELSERKGYRGNILSLDVASGEDEDSTLHDAIGEEAALPYERMENHLIVDRLHLAMQGLSQGESMVVALRWTPYQDCTLMGPIHRAPAAYDKMRLWSLRKVEEAIF